MEQVNAEMPPSLSARIATLRSSERMAGFYAIRGSVCYATFAAEGAEPRRDSGEGLSAALLIYLYNIYKKLNTWTLAKSGPVAPCPKPLPERLTGAHATV